MPDNTLYNLMHQLTQEAKSLWRIQDDYLKDAEGNAELTAFWTELKKEKEAHIAKLKVLIKEQLG